MKSLTRPLTLFMGLCLMVMCFSGCSDNDSSSSFPSDFTNRLYVTAAESGALVPTDDDNEYFITFYNVVSEVRWFTDRPQRETGEDSTANFVETMWSRVYGDVAPNAVIKFHLLGENAGVFVTLRNPEYDSDTKILSILHLTNNPPV